MFAYMFQRIIAVHHRTPTPKCGDSAVGAGDQCAGDIGLRVQFAVEVPLRFVRYSHCAPNLCCCRRSAGLHFRLDLHKGTVSHDAMHVTNISADMPVRLGLIHAFNTKTVAVLNADGSLTMQPGKLRSASTFVRARFTSTYNCRRNQTNCRAERSARCLRMEHFSAGLCATRRTAALRVA